MFYINRKLVSKQIYVKTRILYNFFINIFFIKHKIDLIVIKQENKNKQISRESKKDENSLKLVI